MSMACDRMSLVSHDTRANAIHYTALSRSVELEINSSEHQQLAIHVSAHGTARDVPEAAVHIQASPWLWTECVWTHRKICEQSHARRIHLNFLSVNIVYKAVHNSNSAAIHQHHPSQGVNKAY